MKGGDPKPGVESVKGHLRVYPLGDAAKLPEMNFVNISGTAFNTIGPEDFSFFGYVNRVIQDEPSDAMDPEPTACSRQLVSRKASPSRRTSG